jgi:hypothetical protein
MGDPRLVELFQQQITNRINQGQQAASQGMQGRIQMYAQQQAMPTSGKNDWLAGIVQGVTSGLGGGGSMYQAMQQPRYPYWA